MKQHEQESYAFANALPVALYFMRLILLFFACQVFTLSVYGQLDAAGKSFVYTILKREPASDSIRYTDRLKTVGTFSLSEKNFRNSSITGHDPSGKRKIKITVSKADNIHLQKGLRDFYKVA